MRLALTKPLDRRSMLKGVGAALALPWMESMTPAIAKRTQAGILGIMILALRLPSVFKSVITNHVTGEGPVRFAQISRACRIARQDGS